MNCPHCNVHIDEHPASRCLDAWVARGVMDWMLVITHDDVDWVCADSEGQRRLIPAYSTDIAAAWEVVEKLSQYCYVDIGVDVSGAQVQIDVNDNGEWQLAFVESTRADTAPLAISRAAIKARKEA